LVIPKCAADELRAEEGVYAVEVEWLVHGGAIMTQRVEKRHPDGCRGGVTVARPKA
jgi:hypothetical protein